MTTNDQEAEPLKVTLQTAEQFLSQAQEPELAAKIDAAIDTIQTITGATDRKMLRAYALLLRSIGTSMPWDEKDGLDARRFHMESKSALPSWRQCIGACLQLEFTKPDDIEIDAEIEDAQVDEIQAEEEAEAEKAVALEEQAEDDRAAEEEADWAEEMLQNEETQDDEAAE
jgi:hypothetical protein